MGFRLSIKLVGDSIRKNREVYYPALASSVIMTALLYIIFAISHMLEGEPFRGATSIGSLLKVLALVFVVLAAFIFLYANSFLARRRRPSFGLYAVLGLRKKDLIQLYLLDSLFFFLLSGGLGIGLGLLASQLVYALIQQLFGGLVSFPFSYSPRAVLSVLAFLVLLFFFLLVVNIVHIRRAEIVDLLNAEKKQEKEPKAPLILCLLAILLLGGAFYLANTFESPNQALTHFLVAVPMVIAGTYLIFTGLAVYILKALQARKSFYYKENHFFVISKLLFRIKASAGALATTSILFTCAFLTFSVTATMYVGLNKVIENQAPRDIIYRGYLTVSGGGEAASLKEAVIERWGWNDLSALNQELAKEKGPDVVISDELINVYYTNPESQVWEPLPDDLPLLPGETYDLQLQYGYNLKGIDPASYQGELSQRGEEERLAEQQRLGSLDEQGPVWIDTAWTSYMIRSELREDMQTSFGTLFFIGIYFIIFFLVTTSLVLYFKQLNEAYSDREDFQTLQELGLAEKGVKHLIRSQVLVMFFLPICFSILNVFASYKVLWALLEAITEASFDQSYFLWISAFSVLLFGLFYLFICFLTSRSYYRIVQRKVA